MIDPRTYKVVAPLPGRRTAAARRPVVGPADALRHERHGNSLTPIDPRTGRPGRPIPVDDPYNMYFTPDGRYAIVVAERLHRLDFRDPHTFALHRSLHGAVPGVDHMDFTADGALPARELRVLGADAQGRRRAASGSSEDRRCPTARRRCRRTSSSRRTARIFYVADMMAERRVGDRRRAATACSGSCPPGVGAHGLYPSRTRRCLYVTNRGEGSISVISFRTRRVVATWRIPAAAAPTWAGSRPTGRCCGFGPLQQRRLRDLAPDRPPAREIPVGAGPHGVCVWPQPGRYSLGHTGILR